MNFKNYLLGSILGAIILVPSFVGAASTSSFEPQVNTVWNHGDFAVVKYDFDFDVMGLGKFSDKLFIEVEGGNRYTYFENSNAFYPLTKQLIDSSSYGDTKVIFTFEELKQLLLSQDEYCSDEIDRISATSLGGYGLCLIQNSDGVFILKSYPAGRTLRIGYGLEAIIQSGNHVFWVGTDHNLYKAFIKPGILHTRSPYRAVKSVIGGPVYLVRGNHRFMIPNEKIYFSWFDSWDQIEIISQSDLEKIPPSDQATFQHSTMLQFVDESAVYQFTEPTTPVDQLFNAKKMTDETETAWHFGSMLISKRSSQLKHIKSEEVAASLYGPEWHKYIVHLDQEEKNNFEISTQQIYDPTMALY